MSKRITDHHEYWNSFYARRAGDVPEQPSDFARWAINRMSQDRPVVELGFGTARDSLWFASNGHPVTGYDFAESAVDRARQTADQRGLPASFEVLDLGDADAVQVAAKEILATTSEPSIYGRFLLHSLEADARGNLLDLASRTLAGGGELFLEFRTGEDRESKHVFGEDHFREYLDPAVVVRQIEERDGTVTHLETGHGLAVYRTEDPHVARVTARWKR